MFYTIYALYNIQLRHCSDNNEYSSYVPIHMLCLKKIAWIPKFIKKNYLSIVSRFRYIILKILFHRGGAWTADKNKPTKLICPLHS